MNDAQRKTLSWVLFLLALLVGLVLARAIASDQGPESVVFTWAFFPLAIAGVGWLVRVGGSKDGE